MAEVVGAALQYVVLLALGVCGVDAVTQSAIAARPNSPVQVMGLYAARFCYGFLVVVWVVLSWNDRELPVLVRLGLAVTAVAGLLSVIRAVRLRRITAGEPSQDVFTMSSYVRVCTGLVILHVLAIAVLLLAKSLGPPVALWPRDPAAWGDQLESTLAWFLLCFVVGQMTSSLVLRCLFQCFRDIWRQPDGTDVPYDRQYRLLRRALILCAIPSLLFGPLLFGVLLRLSTLRRRYKRRQPLTRGALVTEVARRFSQASGRLDVDHVPMTQEERRRHVLETHLRCLSPVNQEDR